MGAIFARSGSSLESRLGFCGEKRKEQVCQPEIKTGRTVSKDYEDFPWIVHERQSKIHFMYMGGKCAYRRAQIYRGSMADAEVQPEFLNVNIVTE